MITKIFFVNAFAEGLFSGERAGVVLLRHLGQEVFLQALAEELALPITAYILPDSGRFMVRYFTRNQEMNKAGYGSLAAGHIIYATGLAPTDQPILLYGRGGQSKIFRSPHQEEGYLLNQVLNSIPIQELDPEPITRVLGLPPATPFTAFSLSPGHLVLCLPDPASLHLDSIAPDAYTKLAPEYSSLTLSVPLDHAEADGFVVCSYSNSNDTVDTLRLFDLHGALVPYWAEKLGRAQLRIHHQTTRKSQIWGSIDPEGQIIISGRACTILKADPVTEKLCQKVQPDTLYNLQ